MAPSIEGEENSSKNLKAETDRLKEEIKALRKELEESCPPEESEKMIASSGQDFLVVLSHEIRTPLNVILGLSDLLLQQNPREDQIPNLRSLHFSADNMLNLVNNILDFNKYTHEKLAPKINDFNLRETIEALKDSFAYMAEQGDNKLEFRIDANIPEVVRGDRLKLIQVISNLLNNALKFTENGEVSLTVKAELIQNNMANLMFAVTDNGPGISKENLAHIFGRFNRTEDSITRRVGGTGLGLFMVDQLLNIMGSKIHVESTLGKGSRFYFNLKFERILKEAEESAPESKIQIKPGKKKILLAEDMKEHRQVLAQYFSNWEEVQADFVQNGLEVLESLEKESYDIIFLDIKMPQLNGHETIRRIRKMTDGKYRSIPVIALTADVFSTTEESNGLFTDILTKPFKFAELRDMINLYTMQP
jgi:CheY-like chemotaxis protein/nitrogen-specific signal transduction histidine kinase